MLDVGTTGQAPTWVVAYKKMARSVVNTRWQRSSFTQRVKWLTCQESVCGKKAGSL